MSMDTERMPISHDGYLKLWQLKAPSLQNICRHDVLVIDEAQDMTPAMMTIFNYQTTSKVVFGDSLLLQERSLQALGLSMPALMEKKFTFFFPLLGGGGGQDPVWKIPLFFFEGFPYSHHSFCLSINVIAQKLNDVVNLENI